MKTNIKRILNFVLALCLCITMIPAITIQAEATEFTYNPDAAIAFAASHCATDAANHSATSGTAACDNGWLCAEFVAECLLAGGFPTKLSSVAGMGGFAGQITDYGEKITCTKTGAGYVNMSTFSKTLSKGDPIVLLYGYGTGSGNGHVVIYSGETESDGTLKVYGHNSRQQNTKLYSTSNTVEIFAVHIDSYADLGTDFTAPIIYKELWSAGKGAYLIENSYTEGDKPPVRIQTENGKANQLWYFSRQSDGSYMISSCQDGKYLDVRDAGTGTGVVIQTCEASGSDAQKWYLYEKDGGYIIKSKLSGYVLDLVNNDSTSGNTLQTWENNGTTAQIWAIYRGDECKITGPSLTVSVGDSKSNTKFTWNDIYGESCYYIKIWKGTAWEGNSYLEAACTSTSYSVQLPAGTYQAYVDAAHYYDYEMSNLVTFTVSEHQHSYSYKVSTSPTTSATGKLTGTCSKCSGTTTITLPKLNTTDYSYKVITAATCTANGTGRYTWKTTTYGNYSFDVTITKTGHNYTSAVTAPTCTAQGYTTYTCACGDSYIADEVAALGHSFTNYVSNNDATCTEDGTKTAKCDRCDVTDTITDVGSVKGHDYADATCTAPKTCKVCGATEGDPLGHSFTNYVSNNDATCTEDGTKTAKCDCCDVTDTITDVGSAKGHDYADATCTAPKTCKVCGATEGDPLGHSFTNYISNGDATCTEDGTKTAKCDRCDATDTVVEEGSATGHSYTSEVTSEPTCEDKGIKTFTCICGDSYTEEIPPTGEHEYEDGYCKHCGERETAYIPGDINGDGNVNARDVTKLLQYLAEWDVEVVEATLDINGDGKVNVRDVTLLKQYIAGWDVELF